MAGKPVVTANKELLANYGRELFETAEANGVDLLFEASVCGGIPLMRPLRESLAGDRIRRVMGIVNGTTNFILTRMTESGIVVPRGAGRGADARLRRTGPHRRRRGLRRRRQGRHHRLDRVRCRRSWPATSTAKGSPASRRRTSRRPGSSGYVVKLLALAEEFDGEIAVRVHPAMVPGATTRWPA